MMRRTYIWEASSWPVLRWDRAALVAAIVAAHEARGRVSGTASFLTTEQSSSAMARAAEDAAVDTSEIEGEHIDRAAARSSVLRRLQLEDPAKPGARDPRADAIVALTLDARTRYAEPLSQERLLEWHRLLFAGVRHPGIVLGQWRSDSSRPMQVVSGAYGRERVDFEAPPAARVQAEMVAFLDWFKAGPRPADDGITWSGVAHLRFVTIHPFEDGNGRIARAIADLALARCYPSTAGFISMSRQIRVERRTYYDVLERTQAGNGDITSWLDWYLQCYARAAAHTLLVFDDVLEVARFWAQHAAVAFSERQRLVITRYLQGFEGNLTTPKYAKLAKVSADTAQRDIADLLRKKVLARNPGGSKRTSYSLIGFAEAATPE